MDGSKEVLGELKKVNLRLDNLEVEQQGMKIELQGMKAEQKAMKSDMGEMKSDISDLKKGQLRLETRMETEVIDKIRILFDAVEVQRDVNQRILASLARIEEKVSAHDMVIQRIQ
ncbi:MAG: hypothetical protein WDA53_06150 [Bacillota bacterium]